MQRIDENTYIDDTLVTCAEYQLFIDEMREQGKYYQPDHWTSYQFPEGQARAPIVGVRFDDVKEFCEWLTRRETGEWSFRLPTSAEAGQYLLKNPVQSDLGYWTTGPDGVTQFAWVGPIPGYPWNLDLARTLARATSLASDLDLARDLDLALVRDLDSARDRALERTFGRTHDGALDFDTDRTLHWRIIRDRALERIFDRTHDGARVINFDLYVDIYALQERIAGRLPAFEGIRIVKERLKP